MAAFAGQVSPAWNIGANPNGGYLLALAAQALRQRTPAQPDPLSITVHYLRPGLSGQPCRIDTQLLRSGRTLSTVRATLAAGRPAAPGAAGGDGPPGRPEAAAAPLLTLPPPDMPPPEACPGRSAPAQGVGLPILRPAGRPPASRRGRARRRRPGPAAAAGSALPTGARPTHWPAC